MRGLFLGAIGLTYGYDAGGTPTPPSINSVAANGWEANMPTPADLALSPVSLSRQGFTATGSATTIVENVLTTKRVRQPYPNQGSLTAASVALSDYVYSTDTIAGVTNNSTETSPKAVANWSIVDRRVVGNMLYLEIVAFHRNGVACVEFSASDGTLTVSAKTSAPIVSAVGGDRNAVTVYAVTLDISTLADNANITCNAKVYPRIGASASVLDSAASSVAREFSPRVWRKNTTLSAAPNVVYVASTGNDTTGYVGTDPVAAAASPCLTPTGAVNRARTVLGTGAGALDGLRVRLTAGTWSLASNPTANTTNAAIVIEPAPGVARGDAIWQFGSIVARVNTTYAVWDNVTLQRNGAQPLLSGGSTYHEISNCILDNASQTTAIINAAGAGLYLTGGTEITNWPSGNIMNAGTNGEVRMLRGVLGGTTSGQSQTESWLWLGCNLRSVRGVFGARGNSGMIAAFNKLTHLGATGQTTIGLVNTGLGDTIGAAIVQNVFEWISTGSSHNLLISADSDTNNTAHIIVWHNSFAGFNACGRANLLYNETSGTLRTHKLQSFVGNIHVQINTKHDVYAGATLGLPDASSRIGGWSFLYAVGSRGEFTRYRDADNGGIGSSFAQAYFGLDASYGTTNTAPGNDPLFTNYQGTTSGPTAGTGGGTYTLQAGSPARGLVSNSPVPFDLTGAARSGTAAAGAYV